MYGQWSFLWTASNPFQDQSATVKSTVLICILKEKNELHGKKNEGESRILKLHLPDEDCNVVRAGGCVRLRRPASHPAVSLPGRPGPMDRFCSAQSHKLKHAVMLPVMKQQRAFPLHWLPDPSSSNAAGLHRVPAALLCSCPTLA